MGNLEMPSEHKQTIVRSELLGLLLLDASSALTISFTFPSFLSLLSDRGLIVVHYNEPPFKRNAVLYRIWEVLPAFSRVILA